MKNKTCKICGKKFINTSTSCPFKTCSDICRRINTRNIRRNRDGFYENQKKTYTCKICGKIFNHTPRQSRITCSEDCRKRNRMNSIRKYQATEKGKLAMLRHVKSEKHKITYTAWTKTEKYKKTRRESNAVKACKEKFRKSPKFAEWMKRYKSSEHYKTISKTYNKLETTKERGLKYKHIRRARQHNAKIGRIDFKWIIERDGGICQLCFKKIDMSLKFPNPMRKSFDHIIPLSKKGEHSNHNLQLAHLRCNQIKNAKLLPVIQQNLL